MFLEQSREARILIIVSGMVFDDKITTAELYLNNERIWVQELCSSTEEADGYVAFYAANWPIKHGAECVRILSDGAKCRR